MGCSHRAVGHTKTSGAGISRIEMYAFRYKKNNKGMRRKVVIKSIEDSNLEGCDVKKNMRAGLPRDSLRCHSARSADSFWWLSSRCWRSRWRRRAGRRCSWAWGRGGCSRPCMSRGRGPRGRAAHLCRSGPWEAFHDLAAQPHSDCCKGPSFPSNFLLNYDVRFVQCVPR